MKLHEYQQAGVAFMSENERCLVALRMGGGKTAITIHAMAYTFDGPFLVVAPKKVSECVWQEEALKWPQLRLKPEEAISILGTPKKRLEALFRVSNRHLFAVVSRDNFVWLVEECRKRRHWPFAAGIVWDEADRLRDHASETSKALRRALKKTRRFWPLAGIPDGSQYDGLFHPMRCIDGGERLGATLKDFRDTWCEPVKTDRQTGRVFKWGVKAEKRDEFLALVRQKMWSVELTGRVKMPAQLDRFVEVGIPMSAAELDERFAEHRVVELSDGRTIFAGSAGVARGKRRQFASGAVYLSEEEGGGWVELHTAKLDALERLAEDGTPLLVFYWFQHERERVLRRFPSAVEYDGKHRAAWQRGEIPMMLLHPQSAGHGVDGLQKVRACAGVWITLPDSLILYEQACARIVRQGADAESVAMYHLMARGSVDEVVREGLEDKQRWDEMLQRAVSQSGGR